MSHVYIIRAKIGIGSGPATVASAPAVANEMMNEKTHEGVSFIFLGQLLMALG